MPIHTAQTLAGELKRKGCTFRIDSPTNQIFPVMENGAIAALSTQFQFYTWDAVDESHSVVRLVTSWATPEEEVQRFAEAYGKAGNLID